MGGPVFLTGAAGFGISASAGSFGQGGLWGPLPFPPPRCGGLGTGPLFPRLGLLPADGTGTLCPPDDVY